MLRKMYLVSPEYGEKTQESNTFSIVRNKITTVKVSVAQETK